MRVPVVWQGDQLGIFDSKAKGEAALKLVQLMSDISERCYSATWEHGTEAILWSALSTGPRKWGLASIEQQDIDRLKKLSDQVQGWIAYTQDGARFVPMAQWLASDKPA